MTREHNVDVSEPDGGEWSCTCGAGGEGKPGEVHAQALAHIRRKVIPEMSLVLRREGST